MKVGCYQCVCKGPDYDANLETLLTGLRQADAEGLAITAFPESLLTGYYETGEEARAHAWTIDGPEIGRVLEATKDFQTTYMVGFNELRGADIYNTVMVVRGGKVEGCYSKAFPVFPYFKPGRDFPVFERDGVKFGIIICADGEYIEPARILALQGAQIIFAPHYNYIRKDWVVVHYAMVRSDHVARAVENTVWFMRANNITGDDDPGIHFNGVGYGDSYLLDPHGQIAAHAGLHCTRLMTADIDFSRNFCRPVAGDSVRSAMELGARMLEAAKAAQEKLA